MKPTSVICFLVGLVASTMFPVSSARAQVSFPGPELLGRPTDRSVTVNVVANAAIEAYFQYSTQAGGPYTQTSPVSGAASPASAAANVPLVIVLGNLAPDTQYFYRMIYRQTGTSTWTTRPEHTFHTQRAPGAGFTFTVGSDSHINIVFGSPSLFQQTLQNIAAENPDFYIDLGDTFAMDGVATQTQANSNYLNMRSYFGLISPSVPIFLALGNHEQEEGWHLGDTGGNFATSPPVMSANARNLYYLNPDPLLDPFYSGNTDVSYPEITGSSDHTIQDYYAWTWGDVLFVVIDPYWYTPVKPYAGNIGGGEPGYPTEPQDADRWRWTLGQNQYGWLEQTLANSTAKYRFIFAHQVSGGMDDYGRGGANAVPFVEWGGYDTDGTTWGFNLERTFDAPVHQLLVKYNVTAFFHGHDHEFAYEKRDGVVYQLVPMAADATYGYGFADYSESDPYTFRVLPNSGHLRVTVSPTNGVTVDYVRAFLAGAGTNASIAYSYTIPPPGGNSGPPSISATAGTPQTAQINSTFAVALQATVRDASNNPETGVPVTFAAPSSGASGTFAGAATVATDASGIATAPAFTANGTAGSYTVTASTAGASNPVAFILTNNPDPAAITSPAPSSTLLSASTTLNWSAGSGGAATYYLWIGTTAGGYDLANMGPFTGTSATVTLPTNGATIHVRLWTWINGTPLDNDYTYTEASAVAAAITSPANGSTLTSASTTFNWTASVGATSYYLWIGTTPGGYDLANLGPFTGTSATVNLPTSGAAIHVRLWTWINGTPLDNDYAYTEAP